MLAIETCIQLQMPLNTITFYIFIFTATVLYYTRAYMLQPGKDGSPNPRTNWYKKHKEFIQKTQIFFLLSVLISGSLLIAGNYNRLYHLSVYDWIIIASIPLTGLLYYGLLPKSILRINLRNTGLIKPFVIGYVWAGWISFLPIVLTSMEENIQINTAFLFWLFIKNWMFCTVNAIMFDIKDYADDSNKQLKTFVVRLGLRKTIFFVLIPLLLVGAVSFLLFAIHNNFSVLRIVFNMIPFICLLYISFSLHQRKPILYYLIVIDGLLLVKAICGIFGIIFQ